MSLTCVKVSLPSNNEKYGGSCNDFGVVINICIFDSLTTTSQLSGLKQ